MKFFHFPRNVLHSDRKRIILLILIVAAAVVVAAIVIKVNHNEDIVRGIDVSAYQGTIDWEQIEDQGITFAYIKATQGTDSVDEQFENNWKNVKKTGITAGAYLFLNLDEDAGKQADLFIKTVDADDNNLPPAIDFELYSPYDQNPPDATEMTQKLQTVIDKLKDAYGVEPIIYTNYNTYNTYLTDQFTECPIWICDLSNQTPELNGNHEWVFWQYTQRGILSGYDGDERFVDFDLYNGDLKSFNKRFK